MKEEENMRPQAIAIETGLSISTVLRTLSRNGISHRVKRKNDRTPLTRSQYNDVRTSKEHGMTSGGTAEIMRVDLAEVNAAWAVTSFERYLEER